MTNTPTSVRSHLSWPLALLATTAFVVGLASGGVSYAHRSSERVSHSADTSAWAVHLVLAAVTAVALLVVHRRHALRDTLLAPLGARAAHRARLTATSAWRGPGALFRTILSLPLAALFFYGFWRAGEQVLGGLDPHFTVNAWGGPTYAGAMFCHYLDGVLIMAACAWLLDRLLAGRRVADRDLLRA